MTELARVPEGTSQSWTATSPLELSYVYVHQSKALCYLSMQSFPQLGKNTFRKASGFRHRGKRVRLLLCVAKGLFEIAASPSVAAYKVLFYECVGGEARGKRLPSGDYAVKNNSAVILYFEIDGPFAETQSRRQVTFNGSLASYVQ